MSTLFNPRIVSRLIWLLALLTIAKGIWVVISYAALPVEGIQPLPKSQAKALYYHFKLAPNRSAPPPKPKPQTVPKSSDKISDLKLLAVMGDAQRAIVTVRYKGKSLVLVSGEKAGCFKLEGAAVDRAWFRCEEKRYEVPLEGIKKQKGNNFADISGDSPKPSANEILQKPSGKVIEEDGRRIVDRSLVDYYTKNFREIGKNVGIVEVRQGDNLEGFKVTFIRKGSDFEKLGLKRGDIIKAVNGQPIDSYQAAMDAYRSVNGSDAMTLVIQRGSEEVELEYEVN